MKRSTYVSHDHGVALILVMLIILLISSLAAGLIFVTNTELWSAMNYRVAVQARYAAEAGVQATINWLNTSGNVPATDISALTATTYPASYSGKPAVLGTLSGGPTSNWPTSATLSSFNSALQGVSVPGLTSATFSTSATLLGNSTTGSGLASWMAGTIQTWQITSQGTVGGLRSATVQVVATFANTTQPIFTQGIVTTATGCKAADGEPPVYFNGKCSTYASSSDSSPCTDSYDSAMGPYKLGSSGQPGGSGSNSSASGGNISSDGYISMNGATVDGNIYTPNPTQGTSCPADGYDMGGGTLSGSAVKYTIPTLPCPWGCSACGTAATACGQPGGCCPPSVTPNTTTQYLSGTTCTGVSGCTMHSPATLKIYDGGSSVTTNQYDLAPGTYGNLIVGSSSSTCTCGCSVSGADKADVVYLQAGGTYNINSISFAQDGQFAVKCTATPCAPITLNITGAGTLPSCGGAAGNVPTAIYDAGNAGFNLCNNGLPGNVGTLQQADCDNGGATCAIGTAECASTSTGSPAAGTPSSNLISGTPSMFQIVYAGTAQMRVGGAPNALVIYMPNAPFYQPGAPVGLNGSIVCNSFYSSSNSPYNYDLALQSSATMVGAFKLIGFSWSKY
jgi:Tfp pilus assembly protein PilX